MRHCGHQICCSFAGVLALLTLALPASAGGTHPAEEANWENAVQLYPGISLIQQSDDEPRPLKIHVVRIDLATPGLKLDTTDRSAEWSENKTETLRQTTRDYIRSSQSTSRKLVFATNADAFSPWPAPWNQSTPTNLLGLAVRQGVVVSPANGTPSFILRKSGNASIEVADASTVTSDIQVAVSGFGICLKDGVAIPAGDDLHPRTALGLSSCGRYLFVVAIDGRRHSSQGATTQELGEILKRYGADDGINMDGGGSTTLAWYNPKSDLDDKCELINSPVGSGGKFDTEVAEQSYVPTERANGNNLGVFYQLAP